MPRRIVYGICRDGIIYSLRDERFDCTGVLRWRSILRSQDRDTLWLQMGAALLALHREAQAPSGAAQKRARQRGKR